MGSIDTKYRNNLPVSDATEELVKFIESKGGKNVHDSRHQRQISKNGYALAGGLVYEFPYRKGLMIQLNADLPSIYVKSIFPNGQHIFDVVPEARNFHKHGKVYSENKKGNSKKGYHAALDHEDWLAPSHDNPVVLLSLIEIDIAKQIVDLICSNGVIYKRVELSPASFKKSDKELSPEELLKKLERQDAIGAKGEELLFEKLKVDFGVEGNPKKSLIHTSKENSSAGYDIEYHNDTEHRYIEVKTTTQNVESDFFFSINEYNVLEAKGDEGFIYRVVLDAELENIIGLKEIKNPFAMKKISTKEADTFKAIMFKANVRDFEK